MSIKEKGKTKTAVSGAKVGEINAQAVILKDHGHGTATESPFHGGAFETNRLLF